MSSKATSERPPSSKWSRGEHLIWLTGSALGICLLMILGLLAVILTNGLGIFWPSRLQQLTLNDGTVLAGELVQRQAIPNPGHPDHLKKHRVQLKVGNRDLYGFDFKWVDESEIARRDEPAGLYLVERSEYGPLVGTPVKVLEGDKEVASGPAAASALPGLVEKAERDRREVTALEKDEIGSVNYAIERIRLQRRRLDYRERQGRGGRTSPPSARSSTSGRRSRRPATRSSRRSSRSGWRAPPARASSSAPSTGRRRSCARSTSTGPTPRTSSPGSAAPGVYASRLWGFLTDEPREANTEGGIFPAIFGTVMMVFIMSLAVVPLGVLAALYLREYAKQGPLVRTVRIAVNNLAGVPSIVFGVFGLGFFVYFVGGGIDRIFFPEALPTPTYGTGGILWASLTLALLTVPVVIVAAEEALAAVPRSMREASLAMGATKFQTILRVVLPAAAPGILTGLILAMARAAGEVAPLMLIGVVKLAPELPLDGLFPFFHLDRKFMHLGFHIYDVGFQSPNVEAAKPMVYTTAVFLLLIVVLMNITAITVRNHLREKYKTGAF